MDEMIGVRRIQSTEIKLCLLFLLDKLGSATRAQLWVLVGRLNLMDYIPFCMVLEELSGKGEIWAPRGTDGILALTAEGTATLNSLQIKIPKSERHRLNSAALSYCREVREKQNCIVYHEAPQNGVYSLCCTMRDDEEQILEIQIRSTSSMVTDSAAAHFRERVSLILNKLYILPYADGSGCTVLDYSKAKALSLSQAGEPLCAKYHNRFAGMITLQADTGTITIVLWYHEKKDAADFAQAAAAGGITLGEEILQLMTAKILPEAHEHDGL